MPSSSLPSGSGSLPSSSETSSSYNPSSSNPSSSSSSSSSHSSSHSSYSLSSSSDYSSSYPPSSYSWWYPSSSDEEMESSSYTCPSSSDDDEFFDWSSSGFSGWSSYPVNYHNGKIKMGVTDIALGDGAVTFKHHRNYDNLADFANAGVHGPGWQAKALPFAKCRPNRYYRVEFAHDDKVNFDLNPNSRGIHPAHRNYPDSLTLDSANKTIKVTRANGTVWTFNNDEKNKSVPLGAPLQVESATGKITAFAYENGRIQAVSALHRDEPKNLLASLEYIYSKNGRLESLTLKRAANGTLAVLKQVRYDYYGQNEAFGNEGDLKTVTTELAGEKTLEQAGTYYYRYYKTGETGGRAHAMKMAFFPADTRLFALQHGKKTCFSLPDGVALAFSKKYYEYDAKNRVALERVDHNRKLITLEYTEYPENADRNRPHRKTVENGPFGNRNIVITNFKGDVVLRETVPPSETGEQPTIIMRKYATSGKIEREYTGGSVAGYAVDAATGSLKIDFAPNEGMIKINEYYNGANGPSGKLFRQLIQNGEAGTPIPQAEHRYEKKSLDGKSRWLKTAEIEFEDEAGTKPITTRFEETFHLGTRKLAQRTTILPAIPVEQNGTGIEGKIVNVFDINGKLRWSKDELGVITHYGYDKQTGHRTRVIRDVDTSKTEDFDYAVPDDWATVADAGLHLVTDYLYDSRGRQTTEIGPENEAVDENGLAFVSRPVRWSIEDDLGRRSLSAQGYAVADSVTKTLKFTLVNPVAIVQRGELGQLVEEIEAARENLDGPLSATDRFSQADYTAWTRHFYGPNGLRAVRRYSEIPDGSKVRESDENVFQETKFGYDKFGRRDKTVAANGLVTKNILDWQGDVVASWAGADEGDLVLMSETVYGGSGGCNSCAGNGRKPVVTIQHLDEANVRTTEYRYDWRGRLIETLGEEDGNNGSRREIREYDNLDRVVKMQQKVGSRLLAQSESRHTPQGQTYRQTQAVINPQTGQIESERHSEIWFDLKGRQIKRTEPGNKRFTEFELDSLGRTVKQKRGVGGKIVSEIETRFDSRGNEILSTQADLTAKEKAVRRNATWFDPAGRVVANVNYGLGNSVEKFSRSKVLPSRSDSVIMTETRYDSKTGRADRQIDAVGRETRTFFDSLGRGKKTVKNFSGNGKFSKSKPDTNVTTETEYGCDGHVVSQCSASCAKSRNEYDVFGRLAVSVDAIGNRTTHEYNRLGELLATTDPMGRTTRFMYDNFGRKIAVILPKVDENSVAPVQKIVYNCSGQVEKQIDPLGNETRMEYNANGKVTKRVDAMGSVTLFVYNDDGKLLSLTDPVGNTTSYEYDEFGRLLKETNELGKSRTFEYGISNQIAKRTDRNGRVITFEYDNFGRQVAENWLEGKKNLKKFSYKYDRLGSLISVDDGFSKFDYELDSQSRETKSRLTVDGRKQSVDFTTAYNELGLKSKVAASIGGYVNEYRYNDNKRIASITQGDKQVEYSYNAAGQRVFSGVTFDGEKVYDTGLAYDNTGRLTGIVHKNDNNILAEYDYSWDAANRITSVNDADYGYDKTSQLVSAEYETLPKEQYDYDVNGNLKNFVTGKNNQLLDDGEFSYEYDAEGNRSTKTSKAGEVTKYTWDHRNRLIEVELPTEKVEYAYDYKNRLVKRTANNVEEFILHDGWQVAMVCDKNGVVTEKNFWGANQDELISTSDSAEKSDPARKMEKDDSAGNDLFALCDHLGTVRDLVDAKGNLVNHLEYNAFGKLLNATNPNPLPRFRYTAKLFDDATGLQWNINRWYDPEVGRWCSEDPIGFKGADTNLSRYVKNSPITRNDYFGLWGHEVPSINWGEISDEEMYPGTLAASTVNTIFCRRGSKTWVDTDYSTTSREIKSTPKDTSINGAYAGILWDTPYLYRGVFTLSRLVERTTYKYECDEYKYVPNISGWNKYHCVYSKFSESKEEWGLPQVTFTGTAEPMSNSIFGPSDILNLVGIVITVVGLLA